MECFQKKTQSLIFYLFFKWQGTLSESTNNSQQKNIMLMKFVMRCCWTSCQILSWFWQKQGMTCALLITTLILNPRAGSSGQHMLSDVFESMSKLKLKPGTPLKTNILYPYLCGFFIGYNTASSYFLIFTFNLFINSLALFNWN